MSIDMRRIIHLINLNHSSLMR